MPFGDWFSIKPENLARQLENGPGSAPLRQTAELFRQLRQTFETLASEVDSLLAQLMSTWSSEASDRASEAFRQYATELRNMAAATDTVSQQADAQADANDNARSSMPKLTEILQVLAALAAARASQNYGLVAALLALYRMLSSRASSTMQGYEGASLPNMQSTPPQQTSPITDQSSSASDAVSKLMESFKPELSSTSTDPMDDLPQSTSSTLAALNDGGFSGAGFSGGGGFSGISGAIGMALGTAAAISSIATGFRMPLESQPPPRGFGSPGGVPAMAPMAGGGARGAVGPGGRTRRDRDKERNPLTETVVATDRSDEVPEIPGIIDVAESDEVAAPGQHSA